MVKYFTSDFEGTDYHKNINLERTLKVRDKRALIKY
jgi:hypothetical protein